jgi:DNA repair protein RecO (recombination protein O)
MPGLYKTEGVVLRRRPIGEADDVAVLLSPTHGRLEAVARSVRKKNAALAGRLEPFSQVRLLIARGRSLDVISQAEVMRHRRFRPDDLYQMASGTYLLELFYRIVEPAHENADERVYAALKRSLDDLEEPGHVPYDVVCRRAELRLMTVLGCAPQLDACGGCGAAGPLTHFSAPGGGTLCRDCRRGDAEDAPLPLSAGAVALLRALRQPALPSLAAVAAGLPARARGEVEAVLAGYLHWHWPATLKSRRFLRQLRDPALEQLPVDLENASTSLELMQKRGQPATP